MNNSLKSVPNDSSTFSGKKAENGMCLLVDWALELGHLKYTTKSLPKSLPCMYFISHWTDVKSFFGLQLVLHNNISR